MNNQTSGRLLVVADEDQVIILSYDVGFKDLIERNGLTSAKSLGLQAPHSPGFWVWVGVIVDYASFDRDYDHFLKGQYRRLHDDEWAKLKGYKHFFKESRA